MGLIDLTTRFKGLKHSDSGTKNLLVSKDINDPPKTGGISMQINHRIDDLVRHTKMLARKPGLKFLGNQALLAQTNIKQDIAKFTAKDADGNPLYTGKQKLKALGDKAKKTLIDTVLATASTLAQIPVNGTGTHLIRGLKDVSYLGKQGMKQAHLSAPDGSIIPNGTPKDGLQSFIIDDNYQITGLGKTSDNKYNSGEKWVAQFGTIQRTSPNDYIGIQGSPTNIVKGGNKITALDNPGVSPGSDGKVKGGSIHKNYANEASITVKPLGNQAAKTYPQRPNVGHEDNAQQFIKDINIDGTEVFYSDQIEVTGNKSVDASRGDREARASVAPLADKADPVLAAATTATILGTDAEDIIPFEFNTFYPGNTDGKFLAFRAFLTDFSDNFSGDWAGTRYVGRGEELYNYQGFKRDISFSFKVAAFSKADMQPLYNKLNLLVGSTAPTYRNGNFMMGTLTKVTIGDYLVQTSGFISSVGLSWDSNIPWEMETEGERLPHALDVSISFTPIHDFIPTANSTFIG
jgi:hypothetical protein